MNLVVTPTQNIVGHFMGFRIALIAVRGIDADTLYERYGVRRTGQHEEIAESPVCGATVSTGWELLYLNDYPRPHSEALAELSANSELLFCDVNETCMSSFATGWENGVEKWIVFHDAQQSPAHLVTDGEPPDGYVAIRDAKLREQADDDDDVDHVFDVPIDLFASLTGIRYDMELPNSAGKDYEILEPV
ncbi:hypothetical protein [Symmachiella dynata]|nr:hypothetical protein [Symmachiella dynata]